MTNKIEIPDGEEVITDPVPEKIHDKRWFLEFLLRSTSLRSSGYVAFTYCPWTGNPQDDPLVQVNGVSNIRRVETSELWQAMQEVPEVAAAIEALKAAVVPLENWLKNKEIENEV